MEEITGVRVELDQYLLRERHVVGFETFRGLIDMLRFAGLISIDYQGGDSFIIKPVSPENMRVEAWASGVVARFESFGTTAEVV